MTHRRKYHSPRQRIALSWSLSGMLALALALMLALMLALAACGVSGSAQGSSTAATATPTPAMPGTSLLNGCPMQQAPSDAHTADVVVQGVGGMTQSSGRPVTLKVGQTLHVELAATNRWRLSVADAGSALTQPAGNGWYDAQHKICVWQFTAVKAGSATLEFTGSAVCAAGHPCPQYVIEQTYSVSIQ